jgi:hypothetical protein
MKKIILILAAVGLLGYLGFGVFVRAYRQHQCGKYADAVRGFARDRDSGVTADVMRAKLKALTPQNDPAVQNMVESTVTGIYGHPELTPEQCAAVALDACMNLDPQKEE